VAATALGRVVNGLPGAFLRAGPVGRPVAPRSEPYRPDLPIVAELAAGAVVVQLGPSEPRVLLLHQRDEDRWCLPKGHVDPGESLGATALREVEEETGLREVQLDGEVGEATYRFYSPKKRRNVQKTVVYFLGRTSETTVRLEPIFDRYDWVPIDRAASQVKFDTERHILETARPRLTARA
jgi:8-oxo-dGTP pyrophosphatase MutT (NUDIX family)